MLAIESKAFLVHARAGLYHWVSDQMFLSLNTFVCMCTCVYIHRYTGRCAQVMCVCVWRTIVNVEYLLQLFFTLVFAHWVSRWLWSSLILIAGLFSQYHCDGHLCCHAQHFMWWLGIRTQVLILPSQHPTHWADSLTQHVVNNKTAPNILEFVFFPCCCDKILWSKWLKLALRGSDL